MKGIILAGGKATRLYPITQGVCKQLLPVYDKPMIYYPLSVLMLEGIREILVISTEDSLPQFRKLFEQGKEIGLDIQYAVQKQPRGIADALIVGEKFIGEDSVALILGDNIYFGSGLSDTLKEASAHKAGATILGYGVSDPHRYGIVEYDKDFNVLSIEEKPKSPKSKCAVTGLYFFDNDCVKAAKKIKPSKRGELEIVDVINYYLREKSLRLKLLGRGYAWLDTGTHTSLIEASMFIKTIEERQGLKVGCIEEIAYNLGYITRKQLQAIAHKINSSYGQYLLRIADE